MKNKARIILLVWIVLLASSLDLATKHLASEYLSKQPKETVTVIPGALKFTFTINTGVIGGAFKGKNAFWIVCGALSILIFFYILFAARRPRKLFVVAVALIVAGAFGNVFDRLFYSGVRDFIDFYTIRWPIFNLADAYLTLGAFTIFADYLAGELKKRKDIRMESQKPPAK